MELIEGAYANHVKLREDIQLLASKKDLARFVTISGLDLQSISFESCKKILSKRSGKYLLQRSKIDKPFPIYCEQTAFGGGWLVFQYRYDGSVDFYRNWAEYRNGFGSMDGEFWLGLERLHQLTSTRKYELVVELKDFDGDYKYARRGDNHHNVNSRNESSFAYELIAKQMEYLEQKLDEMESAMKEDRKLIDLQTQSNRALTEALNANNTHMRKEMQLLASKNDLARYMTISGLDFQSISFESCKENLSKRSGKYLIQPTENDEPFLGYCAQTAFGGGWLVIQYRYDGSVDFFRNWTEYRNGFGSMYREFWLGLEHLHRVTTARKHELMVELKDFDGNYIYARYDEFAIGSEDEQYPLTKLGSYTGTAGDALNYHKDMKFSTPSVVV
uniref:Fibrinogen C-terminal domain-containing protein n=1 Tax=Anopheles coluzzii TaxID=1518534 RepID=A0A8W7P1U1_ANOCL